MNLNKSLVLCDNLQPCHTLSSRPPATLSYILHPSLVHIAQLSLSTHEQPATADDGHLEI